MDTGHCCLSEESLVFCLLHRTIFYELTKVFLLAFVALTGVLLLAGVITEATRNGLGPAQILTAIPLLIPNTMPYTHFILRTQVTNDVSELLYGMLKRESCIRHPRFNYEIYVKGMKGYKLQDALFRRRDPKGGYDVIIYAREAELLVNMHKK